MAHEWFDRDDKLCMNVSSKFYRYARYIIQTKCVFYDFFYAIAVFSGVFFLVCKQSKIVDTLLYGRYAKS